MKKVYFNALSGKLDVGELSTLIGLRKNEEYFENLPFLDIEFGYLEEYYTLRLKKN